MISYAYTLWNDCHNQVNTSIRSLGYLIGSHGRWEHLRSTLLANFKYVMQCYCIHHAISIRTPKLFHRLAEFVFFDQHFPISPSPWQSLLHSGFCNTFYYWIKKSLTCFQVFVHVLHLDIILLSFPFLFFSFNLWSNLLQSFPLFFSLLIFYFLKVMLFCVSFLYIAHCDSLLFSQSALCPLMCKINAWAFIVLIDVFDFLAVCCLPRFSWMNYGFFFSTYLL